MTSELARRQGMQPVDLATDWSVMKEQAKMLVQTGFLPASIKTPEQAIAIMLKGRELGLPAMYALSNISIVQGKPCTGAEAIAALIYRDHGDNALMVTETTDERCVVKYKRRAWPDYQTFEFTLDDAKRANLLNKAGPWKDYTKTMLRWRAISAVGKLAFADTVGGLYTPEELGADITITPDGEMEVLPPPAPVVVELSAIEQRIAEAQTLTDLNHIYAEMTAAEKDQYRPVLSARRAAIEQG